MISILAAICLFVAYNSAQGGSGNPEQDLKAVAKTVMDKMAKEPAEKKCAYQKPGKVLRTAFTSDSGEGQKLMIQSPCMELSSLGNWLSEYFESILCAKHTGVHFATIFFLSPAEASLKTNPFFDHLPKTISNSGDSAPTTQATYQRQSHGACPCDSICHEWLKGLMHHNGSMEYIGGLFRTAMDAWVEDALKAQNIGTVAPSTTGSQLRDKITSKDFKLLLGDGAPDKNGTTPLFHSPKSEDIASMPFVPDAAIHYRCGDNLVTHYAFTPFNAFKRAIPEGARSIYVMAESPGRKAKANSVNRCDAIFDALFAYLKLHFPAASIVIMRGQPIFSDLARLTYASTVVCSVSTFCLWPAVAAGGPQGSSTVGTKAYYPRTRLLAKSPKHLGTDHLPSLNYGKSGFIWMNERTILGKDAVVLPIPTLVKRLEGDQK